MFNCCLIALFSLPTFAESQTEANVLLFQAKSQRLNFSEELAKQEKAIEAVLQTLESSLAEKEISSYTDEDLKVE